MNTTIQKFVDAVSNAVRGDAAPENAASKNTVVGPGDTGKPSGKYRGAVERGTNDPASVPLTAKEQRMADRELKPRVLGPLPPDPLDHLPYPSQANFAAAEEHCREPLPDWVLETAEKICQRWEAKNESIEVLSHDNAIKKCDAVQQQMDSDAHDDPKAFAARGAYVQHVIDTDGRALSFRESIKADYRSRRTTLLHSQGKDRQEALELLAPYGFQQAGSVDDFAIDLANKNKALCEMAGLPPTDGEASLTMRRVAREIRKIFTGQTFGGASPRTLLNFFKAE